MGPTSSRLHGRIQRTRLVPANVRVVRRHHTHRYGPCTPYAVMLTAALLECATRYRLVGSRHMPATRMTVSLPATVAEDAMYAPCVADVADVDTLYVYAVDDVLQMMMLDTTV